MQCTSFIPEKAISFQVDQEFKRIRQDVKQTEGSLLNKTNASLQEFENKV